MLIVLSAFGVSLALNVFLFYSLEKVQKQFNEQGEIIKKYDEIDKRLKGGESDLLNTLEKFLNDEAYEVKGKTVSTGDFLLYHNRILDSLDMFHRFYRYANRNYGVNLKLTFNIDSTESSVTSVGDTRADSANILIHYYSDKLSKKGNYWYIKGDYENQYNKLLLENNELLEQKDEMLKVIKELNIQLKKIPPDN